MPEISFEEIIDYIYACIVALRNTVSQTANGLMSYLDKKKLDGIEENANKYVHPSYTARTGKPAGNQTPSFGDTATVSQVTSDGTGHVTGMTDRTIKIPGDVATQAANGLMSSADKKKLDGVADNANNYSHPTSSGNKHIPSGGSSGQILRWSADGTAAWGADNNTTYSRATTSADGLLRALNNNTATYLRGDGTWAVPPDTDTNTTYGLATTYSDGLLRALNGNTSTYMRGDGTWATPPDTNTTYGLATTTSDGLMSAGDKVATSKIGPTFGWSNFDDIGNYNEKLTFNSSNAGNAHVLIYTKFGGIYMTDSDGQQYKYRLEPSQNIITYDFNCDRTIFNAGNVKTISFSSLAKNIYTAIGIVGIKNAQNDIVILECYINGDSIICTAKNTSSNSVTVSSSDVKVTVLYIRTNFD